MILVLLHHLLPNDQVRLWNMETRSAPLSVVSVDKGIMRLALQLGSVDEAHRWVVNWNLAFLDCRAPYLPISTGPPPQVSTLATLSTRSSSLPQETGSTWVGSLQTPGSGLLTWEESPGSTAQQLPPALILSSVHISGDLQQPPVSTLSGSTVNPIVGFLDDCCID